MHMALTGEMLDESAIFAMDNGREASRCGLHDRKVLGIMYTHLPNVLIHAQIKQVCIVDRE